MTDSVPEKVPTLQEFVAALNKFEYECKDGWAADEEENARIAVEVLFTRLLTRYAVAALSPEEARALIGRLDAFRAAGDVICRQESEADRGALFVGLTKLRDTARGAT